MKPLKKWSELTKEQKSGLLFGGLALLLVFLDLLSKWLVEKLLPLHSPVAVIPNFFYITKSYNTGAAFSLGASWGVWGRVLGIAISLIMSVAIVWYWAVNNKKLHNFERACLMLLSSGAVGNLIDRAFYWQAITGFDGVVDFLQFYLGGGPSSPASSVNPFATFNLADACLTVGVVLMVVAMVVDLIKNGKNDPDQKDPRLQKKEEEPKKEGE